MNKSIPIAHRLNGGLWLANSCRETILMVYDWNLLFLNMSHSFSTIWIHAVWATKDRQPLIKPTWESQLHSFLRNQLADLSCPVRIINGMPDHIHLFFLLNSQKSVSDVIKQVKGASSHWVNQQDFSEDKFAWQTGYAAYSGSDSVKEKVFQYIRNQKEHHRKVSFQEEYEEIIKRIQNQHDV